MASLINTPPSSPLTEFTNLPSPPPSPTFWLDLSGAPEPEPVAPPPKRRGRPPKNKTAKNTAQSPKKQNVKAKKRSPSPEDVIRVATPPPRKRKAGAEVPVEGFESSEADEKPRRKKQKRTNTTIAPQAPALVGTRRSDRPLKPTHKASSFNSQRADPLPTPSPTNPFASSPSTIASASALNASRNRRVQTSRGAANSTSTSTSASVEPEPERKRLKVFEIDAALDARPTRPPMSMSQFLRDDRPEGGIHPATGPSATFGTRLPKLDGKGKGKSTGTGNGKGVVKNKGKKGEARRTVADKSAARNFAASPAPSSQEVAAAPITAAEVPAYTQASEPSPREAATPPSSSAPTQKRSRSSNDNNEEGNDADLPAPPPKKQRTERGSSATVELLTHPTLPLPQVAASDILYFAYGIEMSILEMRRKYPGSQFVSCAKVENYKWSVGADDKVKIAPSDGNATWGAIYKISPSSLAALTAKGTQYSLAMSTVSAQFFQRDKSIGWFGNETEAELLAGEVAKAHVLVAREGQDEEAQAKEIQEKNGLLDGGDVMVQRLNRAIVELCPEGLCAAYVQQMLRRWVPAPNTPDGIYW